MQIRSISSPAEIKAEEEGKQRKTKIIGMFLLFILAASSIGYAFISSDSTAQENPLDNLEEGKITEMNGQWVVKLAGQVLSFSSSPESVANISVDVSLGINDYYQKNVYYADKDNAIAYELSQSLGLYALKIQQACYGSCDENLPEKNCSENLIIWDKNAGENKVYQQDKCIFIEGDIRAVDAFLYKVFGIKQN